MHIRNKDRHRRGFSLIELLSVVALIGILATATIPALGNMAASSRRTKYLTDLSTLFEGARQYAVSKNTYVWVAFSENAANGSPLYACVVASRTGLAQGYGPEDLWAARTFDVSNNAELVPVTRVVTLGDFGLTPAPAGALAVTAKFKVRIGAKEVDLSRSVQFSPSGEAKVGGGVQGNIVFATSATEGQMKDVKDSFTVNGPTGFVQFVSDSN